MNELKELIKKTTSFLVKGTKRIVLNNKKKFIGLVVLLIAAYIIKKKMTMAHFLAIIDAITKLIQMLPLPDSPKLRQFSKYQHPNSSPLKSIFDAIKIDEIKKQIAAKQASWQDLKQSIVTGTILTICVYNVNSFYFLVQNKYLEDFKELQALSQFDEAMYCLRKRFTEEIPFIFTTFKSLLKAQLNQLGLQSIYSYQEYEEQFQKLINKIFEPTFDVTKQYKKKSIAKKSDPKSLNYFTSPYEYIPKKKSIFQSVALGALNILGGCIRVFDWFPQPKQEITSHRYNFIKTSYILTADKTDFQSIKWPNQTSKNLFNLVLEEITYSFLSLNFSVLMTEYSKYHKKILMNRIKLWLIANKTNQVKLLKFLPTLYKILKEQFFKSDIKQYRQNYHQKQLKKNIRQTALDPKIQGQGEDTDVVQPVSLQEYILQEIQQKKCFQYLQREFQLKYFHERSGFVQRIRKNEDVKDPKQMEKFLSMISGNEILNQNQ